MNNEKDINCPSCDTVVPKIELEKCHRCEDLICPVCAETHFSEHNITDQFEEDFIRNEQTIANRREGWRQS